MVDDISAQKRWAMAHVPLSKTRGSMVYVHLLSYYDQLMGDLHKPKYRKGWNPFKNCLLPYTAVDYSFLFPTPAAKQPISSMGRRHSKRNQVMPEDAMLSQMEAGGAQSKF